MIDVLNAEIGATAKRVGTVNIKYYDLIICCEICVYKDTCLWIKMPEYWAKDFKKRLAYWENKKISDRYQVLLLKKVFDITGLDLKKAIELKNAFFEAKKKSTSQEKRLTLK